MVLYIIQEFQEELHYELLLQPHEDSNKQDALFLHSPLVLLQIQSNLPAYRLFKF